MFIFGGQEPKDENYKRRLINVGNGFFSLLNIKTKICLKHKNPLQHHLLNNS